MKPLAQNDELSRGSYMSLVLLNSLNELGERDKM